MRGLLKVSVKEALRELAPVCLYLVGPRRTPLIIQKIFAFLSIR